MSPARLAINSKPVDGKGRKPDVRIFISMTSKEPNETDNSKHAINVKLFSCNLIIFLARESNISNLTKQREVSK
jgi:hypothetical protein